MMTSFFSPRISNRVLGHTLARCYFPRRPALRGLPCLAHITPSRSKSIYVRLAHEDLCIQEKWGWVFYRTTYKDDVAWERFRDWIEASSREDLRAQGASPLLLGAFDNIFVSDPSLEGASRQQLRPRFREWRKPAFRAENPTRPLPKEYGDIPGRYIYFVVVDEESLDSVLPGGRLSWDKGWKTGWVHFVRCDAELSLGEPPVTDLEFYQDPHWKVLASRVLEPAVA